MSHYSYHKKIMLDFGDKIAMLVLYSDSSLTNYGYAKNGRKYEYHPKYWHINTMDTGGFLISKEYFKAEVSKVVDDELDKLNQYYLRYEPENYPATTDSKLYAGTIYPGGGKVKNMRAYYSIRKTQDADEWLRRNPFNISVSRWEKYQPTEHVCDFHIHCKNDLIEADKKFRELWENKGDTSLCFSILYLATGDEFK